MSVVLFRPREPIFAIRERGAAGYQLWSLEPDGSAQIHGVTSDIARARAFAARGYSAGRRLAAAADVWRRLEAVA